MINYTPILEYGLYSKNIPFVHICPTYWAFKKARAEFLDYVLQHSFRKLEESDRQYYFTVAKMDGCAMDHYPVVIIEDWADMNPQALKEYMTTLAPVGQYKPFTVWVSNK